MVSRSVYLHPELDFNDGLLYYAQDKAGRRQFEMLITKQTWELSTIQADCRSGSRDDQARDQSSNAGVDNDVRRYINGTRCNDAEPSSRDATMLGDMRQETRNRPKSCSRPIA